MCTLLRNNVNDSTWVFFSNFKVNDSTFIFLICLCSRQKKLEQMMEEEGLKDEEVMNMEKVS